ncbi:Ig-like domain-containing protein [Novosphingobium aquimarinum]|uniref:Ig-like domain-containing protein n=1 Tax=Novosphingobium aquimarinum TaxID=2682494 RepID=UPI0012EC6075|nr:Ig-like domain-containing protein [Novosphingobium aquimarinum]
MAIIVRITSADGKKVITKELPALPANLKVPAGARVDVKDSETGERMSLGQYVNDHAQNDRRAEDGQIVNDKVTIETVDNWAVAEQWLDAYAAAPPPASDDSHAASMGTATTVGGADPWYSGGDNRSDDSVLGYDKNTLTLGAIVGGGLAIGAFAIGSSGGGSKKDTIAPAAPAALDLATADDTGSSTTDNITSVTEGLTISGTAESGSEVELFDGTTSLGTTTASATGTFSFDVDLAAGSHAIRAIATDIAGNESAASAPLNVTVDTTAPAPIDLLDLVAADDTGFSSTDNITNKTSGLTVTGIGAASSTVQLFEGTLLLGSGTTNAQGLFNIDVSLAAGTHSIVARTSDVAGNASENSPALSITVDTTAPLPVSQLDLASEDDTGSSNTDNVTTKTTGLTITGLAEAGAEIELFDISNALGTVIAGADGRFSIDVSLSVGSHTITANVTDVAGNETIGVGGLDITVVEPGADILASSLSAISGMG